MEKVNLYNCTIVPFKNPKREKKRYIALKVCKGQVGLRGFFNLIYHGRVEEISTQSITGVQRNLI